MRKYWQRLASNLSVSTVVAAAAVILSHGSAQSEEWPTMPIKLVISQAAGSAPDIIGRLIAEQLSRSLGQPVIVDNRPGASNLIGAQVAARAKPDGNTIFLATAAALATNPYTIKNLPYDPIKDFVPIAMVATNPFIILANPDVKANTLAELFELDKSAPGKLSIATEGPQLFTGILAAWMNKRAGTKFTEVPYTTITQGIQDALSGRVQLISLPIVSAAPYIANGKLKALAVSSLTPVPGFEKIPSVAATLPGVELVGWLVLVAPAGTPAAIVDRINRSTDSALKDQKIQQRLVEFGFFSNGAETPAATTRFVRSQYDMLGKVIKEIGLEAK